LLVGQKKADCNHQSLFQRGGYYKPASTSMAGR
jgi:hypothetical protein